MHVIYKWIFIKLEIACLIIKLPHTYQHINTCVITSFVDYPGGCFTNISPALQNILSKFVYCRNNTCDENFKLKLCTCSQSHSLGTHTKFHLEIPTITVISDIVYFREIILESLRNVNETTPCTYDDIMAWKCFCLTGPLWGESIYLFCKALIFCLLLASTSFCTNKWVAGYFGCHDAHVTSF